MKIKIPLLLIVSILIGCTSQPYYASNNSYCRFSLDGIEEYARDFDATYRTAQPNAQESYYQCIVTSIDTIVKLVDMDNRKVGRLHYKSDSNYLYATFLKVDVLDRFFPKYNDVLNIFYGESNIAAATQKESDGIIINGIKEVVESARNHLLYKTPVVVCLVTRKGEESVIEKVIDSCDTLFFECYPLEWPVDTLMCDNFYRMCDMRKILDSLYSYEQWGRIIDSCYTKVINKTVMY